MTRQNLRPTSAFARPLGNWLLGILCAALLGSSSVHAGVGMEQVFIPKTVINNGVQLEVDTRGIDGNGYRPVRIRVRSLIPNTADRQFRVELEPQSWNPHVSDVVTGYVELAEGAAVGEVTILVPQDSLWQSLQVNLFEGGQPLDDITPAHCAIPRGGNAWQMNQNSPGVLLIDSDAPPRAQRDQRIAALQQQIVTTTSPPIPDHRNLSARTNPANAYNGNARINDPVAANAGTSEWELLRTLGDNSRLDLLTHSDLPDNWLELSCFDVAVISLADLRILAKSEPKRLQALLLWTNAGHNLVVYGVATDYKHLPELATLLRLADLPSADDDDTDEDHRGWTPADSRGRSRLVEQLRERVGSGPNAYYGNSGPGGSDSSIVSTATHWKTAKGKPPFVVRKAGLGFVAALADEQPFPGLGDDWDWLLSSFPRQNGFWEGRHGVSLHQPNDDYYSFLIRGVGSVPVFSFLVLITLFVIVIGPINYHFLRARGRLYLLLVTVPAGAFVVSAALFVYALLADGLGVRARVRSITWLDGQSGQFTSHSRQTYYAAISPSQGMRFPRSAAVYNIEAEPIVNGYQRNARRQITWSDEQELRGGYIRSRVFSQLLVVNAGETKSRITITSAGGLPATAANQLGVEIRYLAVGAAGAYFDAERIAPAAQAKLRSGKWPDIRSRLSKFCDEFPLLVPEGIDPAANRNRFFGTRFPWAATGPTVNMTQSVLESSLTQVRTPNPAGLGQRFFVAVVDRPETVPLGVAHAQLKDNLHVVYGSW